MSDKSAADWSNYWRGRTGEQSGAALVGAGVENDADLDRFWQSIFQGAPSEARVLDLACGAGSALRHAAAAGVTKLAGADISADALASLVKAVPGAVTTECSAADTPFEDGMFDFVVSQFGIEYAGLEASVKEAARLLAPGGQFAAIAHLTGGGIEQEVSERLEEGQSIVNSNFIPLAKDLFRTARAPRSDANVAIAQKAVQAFQPAEQTVGKLASEKGGLAAHLYSGTRQMYGKLMNYELSDVIGWLDGMHAEIDAYIGRMASMVNSAATEQEAVNAMMIMQQAGCQVAQPQKFQLGGRDAAWVLRAAKP